MGYVFLGEPPIFGIQKGRERKLPVSSKTVSVVKAAPTVVKPTVTVVKAAAPTKTAIKVTASSKSVFDTVTKATVETIKTAASTKAVSAAPGTILKKLRSTGPKTIYEVVKGTVKINDDATARKKTAPVTAVETGATAAAILNTRKRATTRKAVATTRSSDKSIQFDDAADRRIVRRVSVAPAAAVTVTEPTATIPTVVTPITSTPTTVPTTTATAPAATAAASIPTVFDTAEAQSSPWLKWVLIGLGVWVFVSSAQGIGKKSGAKR